MVLGNKGRGFQAWLFGPVATLLLKLGVTPNAVTITGTILTCAVALGLLPTDHLVIGSLALGVLVLTDSIDGIMARRTGTSGPYGAFLDSTLDRFSDSAIFAGLTFWYILRVDGVPGLVGAAAAVACLALGGLVSYARAKAESIGVEAKVGLAERADRLIVALVATLLAGLGLSPWVLTGALLLLAVASLYTVGQRMRFVRLALAKAAS